jgi:hypothetical protein
MSIGKYMHETGGSLHDGKKLLWPGTADGFPVIGNGAAPNLKKEELENIDLRLDFKSKMFELWDPAQKAEFDDINDKIINGWFLLQRRTDNWDNTHNHLRVWLEWAQVYGMLPPKV